MNKRKTKKALHSEINYGQLGKLRCLTEESDRLRLELDELREKADLYAGSSLSLSSKGPKSTRDKIAEYLADKEELEFKLLENMHKVVRERLLLECIISNIKNDEDRLILRMRIINGLSWEKIGEAIHTDRRTAARKFQEIIHKKSAAKS